MSIKYQEQVDVCHTYPVVTICGSMTAADEMLQIARSLSCQGYAVFVPVVTLRPEQQDSALRVMLDRMHRAKIEISDVVVVAMSKDKRPGDSTLAEIEYALELGKPIKLMMHFVNSAVMNMDNDEWREFVRTERESERPGNSAGGGGIG